jgi:DNA topoisomerase IB
MRRVGDELGNTASVARSSYVSPAIIVQWRDGRVLDRRFARRRRSIGSGLTAGLLAEEKAQLTLLRSWQSRRPRPG